MIDGSGSMAGRLNGRTKLDLARQAARTFIDSLPSDAEASGIAFGQQGNNTRAGKEQSCSAINTLAAMTPHHSALLATLDETKAVGWPPLAAAIEQAQAMLQNSSSSGEQIIYGISDGEETFGGDPVEIARRVNQGQTRAIVNIIGFGLPPKEAASLKSVANAGGGTFVDAHTNRAFNEAMGVVRESNRRAGNAVRPGEARPCPT
nr:VWA domain-containing protein [Microvirga makkahensis]